MKQKILFLFLMSILSKAHAAQTGQIVVDQANVHQFPQGASKVIFSLKKGTSLPVSNLPTEGFYKARLPNGDTGWISGNDVLAGTPGEAANASEPNTRSKRKPPQKRPEVSDVNSEETEIPEDQTHENTRILLGGGIESLSYSGLSSNFEKTSGLNLGSNIGIELQRRLSSSLFWGIRIDYLTANTGSQSVKSGTTTQTIKFTSVPIQFGLIWSPVDSRRFRFGLGGYIGASASSSANVTQTDAASTGNVVYSTVDPIATLAAQFSFKFGAKFGIFFDGEYHYQQTGTVASTTQLGAIPGFKINYSGYLTKAGIELRF